MAKEKSKMKLAEILKGCMPGKIQSVGVMQVIPLVSEISDESFVSPNQSAKVSTSDYGTLVFQNQKEATMIIPPQAGYVVKQSAQDHALPHVGVVEGKKTASFDSAMCIQSSQGGTIGGGEHNMLILPFPLREKAHKTRNNRGYDRLWKDIRALNTRAGVSAGGSSQAHLEYFLNAFKEQLDQFVAEFEPVDKQVGAIILINGRVVGVERTPSYTYWTSIWAALIRECYGSLAIIEANDYNNKVPPTRVPLRKATSVSDLKAALKEASDEEYARVKKIVNDIADIDMGQKVDNTVGEVDIEELSSKRFVGQIVRKGETVVYASLVATKEWRDNEEWNEAESFSM